METLVSARSLVECILSLLAQLHRSSSSSLPSLSRAGASGYSPTLTGNFLPRRDIVSDVVVSVDGVEVKWVIGSLAVLRSSSPFEVAGLLANCRGDPARFSRRTAGRLRMFTLETTECAGCNIGTG